jgi:hypothetical protein
MRGRLFFAGIVFLLVFMPPLSAQEGFTDQDFGFGFAGDEEAASGAGESGIGGAIGSGAIHGGGIHGGGIHGVAIHGEAAASVAAYFDDFSEGLDRVELGNIFSGKLSFSALSSMAEGFINLKIAPDLVYYDGLSPVYVDEAYIRAYFGDFDLEAGLRKLSWGKADSSGPLDVINPLDSSEIYPEMADSSDLMDLKIARPLIHVSWHLGEFSKLEGVFVPNFEPHRFAESGRWAPAQMGMMLGMLSAFGIRPEGPNTASLDYAQAGIRFTSTIGSSDIGSQYYYGRLPQPALRIWIAPLPGAEFLYNRYHQIGLDHARVVYGFNTRAELAANITEDLEGDDGSVYNPALAWSLGFDRDLFLGINLNVQADETIRLMHNKLGAGGIAGGITGGNIAGGFDIEGGTKATATRVTATLSRKFLRDELELRAALVWGIEDKDFVFMPALIWTRDAFTFSCAAGVFGGDKAGQLGQYHKNNFIKAGLRYSF